MRLTTKGRYAVTAMLDLAINAQDAPISLADISERQNISLSYLEQLFAKLRNYQLVNSIRGPGGGYKLTRTINNIHIAEIIDAVNETVDATRCQGKHGCHSGDICLTHHLWHELSEQIHDFLSNITLADLVNKKEIRDVANRQQHKKHSDIPIHQHKITTSTIE